MIFGEKVQALLGLMEEEEVVAAFAPLVVGLREEGGEDVCLPVY